MRDKKDIQEELKALSDRVTELQAELNAPETTRLERLGFYLPNNGDVHYWVGGDAIMDAKFDGDEEDVSCVWRGNSFKTEQDAQAAAKRREIMADLWRNSKEFENGEKNFCIEIDMDGNIGKDFYRNFPIIGAPYFTEEKAQEMINKWGDDLKLLLI